MKADRVAFELDGIEINMTSFDAIADAGLAECPLIGQSEAENLQDRHHQWKFVDVGVGEANVAAAGQRVTGAPSAIEFGLGDDLSAEVLSPGRQFQSAPGEVGVDERRIDGVTGFVSGAIQPLPKTLPPKRFAVICRGGCRWPVTALAPATCSRSSTNEPNSTRPSSIQIGPITWLKRQSL